MGKQRLWFHPWEVRRQENSSHFKRLRSVGRTPFPSVPPPNRSLQPGQEAAAGCPRGRGQRCFSPASSRLPRSQEPRAHNALPVNGRRCPGTAISLAALTGRVALTWWLRTHGLLAALASEVAHALAPGRPLPPSLSPQQWLKFLSRPSV